VQVPCGPAAVSGDETHEQPLMRSSHREGVRSRKNHEPEDLPGRSQPPLVVRGGEGSGSIRPETILKVLSTALGIFYFKAWQEF
jgi:hypothetical protein